MAKIQFKNLAASTLIEDVATNGTQLKIVVADADKFPTISAEQYFIVAVINSAGEFEIMRVTSSSNGVFTVTRSQEGTAAKAFQIGDRVEHRLTAESLVNIVEEASITKYHTSEDPEQYGHATSTLYSHVKITDDPTSSASALLGIGISPYAVKTRFDQLAGATTQQAITASGNFTVPETGTYEVICVGGGGRGGYGGGASEGATGDGGENFYIGSGGGGGGGGAGQQITTQVALTKGTVVAMVVGASGGATNFGTYVSALAGANGNNGGSSSGCGCSCGNMNDYYFSGPGSGGTGGYSYGSVAAAGSSGSSGNYSYRTCAGGAGGNGGVSLEGTYGNGGKGGQGQSISNPQAGCSTQIYGSTTPNNGTQGCVKIRMVLGA